MSLREQPLSDLKASSMQVINVMAASLDGRIGLHDREGDDERLELGLTGEADRAFLRDQMAEADAIIVGATSIRANGCCLDQSGRDGKSPSWFIFAQSPLPFSFAFWEQTHIPRYLISEVPLPIKEGSGVTNLVYGQHDSVSFLLEFMEKSQFEHVLLFGGGIVNRWFYERNLVNELRLSLAPIIIGKARAPYLLAPELNHSVKFALLASQSAENFVFLRYRVTNPR